MKLIEYGHLYVDDLLEGRVDQTALQRSVELAQKVAMPGDQCWVLLDDKAHTLDQKVKSSMINKANGLFEELGLLPHKLHFEKAFTEEAPELLQALPQHQLRWERFRKLDKRVLFFSSDDTKIALAHELGQDGVRHYSCPLLAALWRRFKQRHAEDTLTILEDRYQIVERHVDILLRASGYVEHGNHTFLWH